MYLDTSSATMLSSSNQNDLSVETWVDRSNRLANVLASTCKPPKNHFKADISCISLADIGLTDVTQPALTWVGLVKR